MAFFVQMPALGESVTEGTVTAGSSKKATRSNSTNHLLEVSTDKVDTEIPSQAAGVLTKIIAQEDDTVEVGGELAVIGDAAEGQARRRARPAPPTQAPNRRPRPTATEPAPVPQRPPARSPHPRRRPGMTPVPAPRPQC